MTTADTLQRTLRGEHAAVYVYGVLGARTSRTAEPALFDTLTQAYTWHRQQRDTLTRTLRELGLPPEVAAVAYDLPGRSRTVAQIVATAVQVERRSAESYADLVANSVGDQRGWAAQSLGTIALRLLTLGEAPSAFPGLGELGG